MDMEIMLSLAIGLGLSAACGFRIFVPLLVMNLASQAGYLTLDGSFAWIGSTPALIAFASATALEIGAYYIPVVDNFLDTVSAPAAVVAGTLTTASQVTSLAPLLGWSVALIAGGGLAGTVHGMSALTRGASTLATAGFGNPIVSTFEAGASLFMALFAIVVPIVAVAMILMLLYFAAKRFFFRAEGPSPA